VNQVAAIVHWESFYTEDMELAELWVLADKMGVPALQDFVLSTILEISKVWGAAPFSTLPYVYNNTRIGSPLRRLMASLVALSCETHDYSNHSEFFPHAFLIDLATRMSDFRYQLPDLAGIKASDFLSPPSTKQATRGSGLHVIWPLELSVNSTDVQQCKARRYSHLLGNYR
jgi:hypothetical protein